MRRRGEIATEFFADRVGLFPHVKEVLEDLREMKLHLAVATSSVSASARPFLNRHQLTAFFEVIVTGDEIERGKPHPDIYLDAAARLSVAPNECLVIEDYSPALLPAKPQACASPRFQTAASSIRASMKRELITF